MSGMEKHVREGAHACQSASIGSVVFKLVEADFLDALELEQDLI